MELTCAGMGRGWRCLLCAQPLGREQELPGLCCPQSSAHPSHIPLTSLSHPRACCAAIPAFRHCPDLPRDTLAFEAAAVAPGVQEQRESCQKSKKLTGSQLSSFPATLLSVFSVVCTTKILLGSKQGDPSSLPPQWQNKAEEQRNEMVKGELGIKDRMWSSSSA